MYRIIGITEDGKMKLIKNVRLYDSNGGNQSFQWCNCDRNCADSYCTWGTNLLEQRLNGKGSGLNPGVDTNLFIGSTNFPSDKTWLSMIEKRMWMYGDVYGSRDATADQMFLIETGKKVVDQGYLNDYSHPPASRWTESIEDYVGLMYLQDY